MDRRTLTKVAVVAAHIRKFSTITSGQQCCQGIDAKGVASPCPPLWYDAARSSPTRFSTGRGSSSAGGVPEPSTNIVRILIDYRPALKHRTGVGLWVTCLVEALARQDAVTRSDLTVFSSSWKDRLTTALPPGVRGVDGRVPVQCLNWLWHRHEWPPVELLAGGPFDVVHSPTPLLVPSRGAAHVVTIHDLDFLNHPERGAREIRRDYARLARAHAHRADVVVTPSQYTAERVVTAFDLAPDRIVVCPNGAPGWPARPATLAPEHLLFVGTVSARKNVGRLLEAYARVRVTHPHAPPLVLAGKVSPQDAAILEPLARAPLAGHVRHQGYVDNERLRGLYERAIALILPSLDEGFGVPALEAMEMGVPVLAARRGALPEVVGDAGLLVDPLDVGAMATAIEQLVTDDHLRRRLSTAGPVQARRFSWEASAARLREAYAMAVEHRLARTR